METDELMRFFETNYKKIVEFDRHLGMNLEVKSAGNVSYTLALKKQHLTAPEQAHGGVTAAMMDATLGVTALSYAVTKKNLCVTVEFKINYLKPGRPGYTLMSQGWVKHKGKRLIVAEGDIIEKETGDLVATGLGTFTQYPEDMGYSIQSAAEAENSNV